MSRLISRLIGLGVLLVVAEPSLLYSHQGHHHDHVEVRPQPMRSDQAKLKEINETYLKHIKPIFQRKCMDCHSDQTRHPWYYPIPGIKQAIDGDIAEAKQHLDFSKDFPFISHASIQEDLDAIQNSVSNETMPPFSYRLRHPGTRVSVQERKLISEWVHESKAKIGKQK